MEKLYNCAGQMAKPRTPQLGDAFAGCAQGKCENFGILVGRRSGPRFGDFTGQRRLDQNRCRLAIDRRRREVRGDRRTFEREQVAYL